MKHTVGEEYNHSIIDRSDVDSWLEPGLKANVPSLLSQKIKNSKMS